MQKSPGIRGFQGFWHLLCSKLLISYRLGELSPPVLQIRAWINQNYFHANPRLFTVFILYSIQNHRFTRIIKFPFCYLRATCNQLPRAEKDPWVSTNGCSKLDSPHYKVHIQRRYKGRFFHRLIEFAWTTGGRQVSPPVVIECELKTLS